MSGVEHQHLQQQELRVRAQGADAAALSGRGQAAATASGDVVSIPVPDWFTIGLKNKRTSSSSGLLTPTVAAGSVDAKLKAGLYGVVRSLLRVLEKGVVGKAIVDTVLDACSAMQVGVCAGAVRAVSGPSLGVGRGGSIWTLATRRLVFCCADDRLLAAVMPASSMMPFVLLWCGAASA
jgi:hypothetical protein